MDLTAKEPDRVVEQRVSTEQARYARVLDWSMRISLGLILAGFVVYMLDVLPARLPASQLPHYWSLPLGEFIQRTGATTGWSWIFELDAGDYLVLGSIAVLTAVPVICLAAIVPGYARDRDWTYLGITVLLICVLSLAASGYIVS